MVMKIISLKNPATERSLKIVPTPNRSQKLRVSDFVAKPCTSQIKSPELKYSKKWGLHASKGSKNGFLQNRQIFTNTATE